MLNIKYKFAINNELATTIFKNPFESSHKEKAFEILTFFTGGSFILSDEKDVVYHIRDYDLLNTRVVPDGMIYILKICLEQINPKLKLDMTLNTKPINEDFINKKFNIPEPFDPENEEVSDDFILDNYIGLRDSDTGKINAIKFEWDGAVLEREDIPNLFDRIVDVLELNPDQAEILIKKDFM